MRVLLTGSTGLIGSAVLAALGANGDEVIAVTRARRAVVQAARTIGLDIAHATKPEDWLPHLTGIDALVNCAGVLQDSRRDSTAGVHVKGMAALFAACEVAGVRRVIHISALGVERAQPTAFSRTKLQGDRALMARDLDWVILRPSVVVGRAAYGGSALFRGLAALPILPAVADTGPLQIVQLDDLVRTVLFFLRPDAPIRRALDIAGPRPLPMTEVMRAYRRWLGWPRAPILNLPRWLSRTMFCVGDALGWLGWRLPMRGTARREIAFGSVGNPGEWSRLTGIEPQSLEAALAAEPASVQEHWFARLYWLKPLSLGILAFFWIGTGLLALGPSYDLGLELIGESGAGRLAGAAVMAGAFADIAVGLGIAVRRTARVALGAALAISLCYLVAGTILVPRLWLDPLGPMLKILPIMGLNLVALAILDDR